MVRAAGAGITALSVEEGRLDLLYRELVAGGADAGVTAGTNAAEGGVP
jgi:hypothetical protein